MKVACIVNPASGGGKYHKKLAELRQALQSLEPGLAWEETKSPGHATELARQMTEAGVERLVVIGGDGTLSEVANGILPFSQSQRPALAVLAQGTGGDYSRRLKELAKFPKDPRWILNGKKLQEKWVDVGELKLLNQEGKVETETTRYFLNIAQAGLGGEVVRRVNLGGKKLGGFEYPKATLLGALNYHPPKIKLSGLNNSLQESQEETKLLLLIIAKGRYFGGGMCIAPEAELDNGEFQVLFAPPVSYLSLLYHLPEVYRRKHFSHPKVRYYQTPLLQVSSLEEPLLLDLDGEFFQAQALRAQAIPHAIRILLPS